MQMPGKVRKILAVARRPRHRTVRQRRNMRSVAGYAASKVAFWHRIVVQLAGLRVTEVGSH
eukprot:5627511-Amphidinium_carterae.1